MMGKARLKAGFLKLGGDEFDDTRRVTMYRELLYGAGGGIIGDRKKLEQDDSINIVIGLGGTGIDCLRVLKRKVFETVKPDGPGDENPSYAHIKFLAVDTDQHAVREDSRFWALDREREFFGLSHFGPLRDPESAGNFLAQNRPELACFDTRQLRKEPFISRISRAFNGASGLRQIGRLYMVEMSDAFCARVRELIMEALIGAAGQPHVYIHIFSGLGGGTGSGVFLDVCYLVQRALEDIGVRGRADLFGYFFQTEVNLSVRGAGVDRLRVIYMRKNGCEALKELDYCMSFETNGGEWDQQYIGFRIGPTRKSPVDYCHLIGARYMKGDFVDNAYDHAMNVVAEHVMQFLVYNAQFPIQRFYAGGGMANRLGASGKYIVLGAAEAAVPTRDISTYLGSKLFKGFSAVRDNHPGDEEIEQIAELLGVEYRSMMELVMEGTSLDIEVPTFEEKKFRSCFSRNSGALTGELRLPEEITNLFHQNTGRVISQVEKNIAAIRSGWKGLGDTSGKSISGRTFEVLRGAAIDPRRGPFYAAEVLRGDVRCREDFHKDILWGDRLRDAGNKDLLTILRETWKKCKHQQEGLIKEERAALESFCRAQEAYLYPRIFQNRQRLFDALIEAAADFYTARLKRSVLERIKEMILPIEEQLLGLHKECFWRYRMIYDELLDTFLENERSMCSGDEFTIPDDPFVVRIPETDGKLKALLDEAVAKVDLDQAANEFNSGFFSAFIEGEAGGERKIAGHVSDFVRREFSAFECGTMLQYLKVLGWDGFGSSGGSSGPGSSVGSGSPGYLAAIGNRINREILPWLNHNADLLFHKRHGYQPSQDVAGYILVPQSFGGINGVFNQFNLQSLRLSAVAGFEDRILVLRYLRGVSLSDWDGVGGGG